MKCYWVLEVSFWSIFQNLDKYFIKKKDFSTAFYSILLEFILLHLYQEIEKKRINIWKRSNKTLLLASTVDFLAKPSRLGTHQHVCSNLFSPHFWFMASKIFFEPFRWLSESKNSWIGPYLNNPHRNGKGKILRV